MSVPAADQDILARRSEIAKGLKSIIPSHLVIDDDSSMRAFDADGLSAYRQIAVARRIARNNRAGRCHFKMVPDRAG